MTETMSVDEVIEAFNTKRRRRVVDVLERDGCSTVGKLATQIGAWENDVSTEAVAGKQRQRVYVPLHQNQLDILDDAGVVEWDQDRGTVDRGPTFENALEILTAIRVLCSDENPNSIDNLRVLTDGGNLCDLNEDTERGFDE